ncbi:MAG: DegT/DnrJ/EryC1/StrS family aminotransferase [Anaerolineae bacterium]|nr:DegT/DnrJ/EryC1/StrS family aminotransferase [Anaerolineae bacterium]
MKLYQQIAGPSRETVYQPDTDAQPEPRSAPETVPMSSPDISGAEIETVTQVLRSRWLSMGPQIDAFEQSLANYVGAAYAAGVNSGTSGLHLSLIAASVEPGDWVITTPFSFIASANCILYERAVPIFVDVDLLTGNIDPELVAEAACDLTRSPQAAQRWLPPALRQDPPPGRLKVLLPVHAFGQPADMDRLQITARLHNLTIIEDACEAIGAEYKGRRVGAHSDAAVFAFYPNKQITTGEGGMIVTKHEHWAELFRSLRNQGRDVFNAWLNHTRLGYNYRLDELSAALGKVQLQRLDDILEKRAQVAAWYNERLAGLSGVQCPHIEATTTRMSWFVYVIQLKPPINRDAVMAKLAEANIPSRPYFTPIHLQPFYQEKFGFQKGNYPITEQLGERCLALPFSSVMTEAQVDYVSMMLKQYLG